MIGKLGQAWMAKKYADEDEADTQALLNAIEQQRAKETAAYIGTKFGGQDLGNAPVEGQMGPPTVDQTRAPANPVMAIAQALASDDPMMQQRGWKDMEGLPTAQDLLKAAQTGKLTSEGLAAFQQNPANPAVLAPMPNMVLSDGVAVTEQGGRPVSTTPVNQYSGPIAGPGGIPVERNLDTGKTHGIAGGNLTNPGQKTVDAIGVKSADAFVEEIKASKANLLRFKGQLPNLEQMPDLIRKAETGAASDLKNLARRWGDAIGIPVDTSKIDSYQTLKRELFMPYIEKLRMQGSGQSMSDKDAMRAIEGALADPTFNADAMIRAVNAQVAGIMNATAQHGQLLEAYGQMEGSEPFVRSKAFYVDMPVFTPEFQKKFGITGEPGAWRSSLTEAVSPVKTPATIGGAQYQNMSDEELLKKLRGGK